MINYQIKLKAGEPEKALKTAVERAVKADPGKYSWHIEKRSVDARDKENILLVYTIAVEFNDTAVEKKLIDRSHGTLKHEEPVRYSFSPEGMMEMPHRPVVVGAGPAGMFAAFMLSSFGYAPLVIERGSDVDSRTEKVSRFWETGVLDEECNVQFGEGGAGTFSDGKLNTGVKDKSGRIRHVLETFVRFGAPEEILFSAKPHIGTDILKNIMKNMRLKAIENGAEFKFDTKV
ncbi:MAG: FAD-dependent oxidoreductase, partial [Lachnospiraceae bacterium]|nr:FAD-dependent oxidoreductase [Lachnospiraceae bacterium]